MKPLDPRLVRSARSVRVHLAVTVACGAALTGLIIAQAWLVSRVIAGAASGSADLAADLGAAVAAVGMLAVARAALHHGAETASLRGAARVTSDLRRALAEGSLAGPSIDRARVARPASVDAGEIVTLATRGLDALETYVARYLPQLVLAALVPAAVLVVVVSADWMSALVIGLTLPLIPVFMALVGWYTEARTQRQWRLLERLGGHFLDVVEGLPTLAVFRRAKAEAALIRAVTDEHRRATMGTLRVAFLSAFVLELLSTLAVALVAVEIGLRLLYGRLDLETALLVLILAPEAYLPIREVGARFHASQEGLAAAERMFALLDAVPAGATRPAPRPDRVDARARKRPFDVRFEGVTVQYPGRDEPAVERVDLELRAGETTLVTGPSGSGKSTLLALLLRFVEPTEGRITVGGIDIADVSPDEWRRRIAWLPQHPYLFDASIADNIRLGALEATDSEVQEAARLADAHEMITALPDGYATKLGERGTRLSAGQRQRIALARAFLRDAEIVLLDEPTAHLDPDTAATVRAGVARLVQGRTAVIVAHDKGWEQLAHKIIPLNEWHFRSIGSNESAVRPDEVLL